MHHRVVQAPSLGVGAVTGRGVAGGVEFGVGAGIGVPTGRWTQSAAPKQNLGAWSPSSTYASRSTKMRDTHLNPR